MCQYPGNHQKKYLCYEKNVLKFISKNEYALKEKKLVILKNIIFSIAKLQRWRYSLVVLLIFSILKLLNAAEKKMNFDNYGIYWNLDHI